MPYESKNVNGDAGEYFLCYRFTKLLGWPCRMYGVDIGIDAEIEILDDESVSTGNLIKVQVKSFDTITFNADGAFNVYLDEDHIRYWKNFCAPVAVCAVCLSTEAIYWKAISSIRTYRSAGKSMRVSFCKEHDLVDATIKGKLRGLVADQRSEELADAFKKLGELVDRLPTSDAGLMTFDAIDESRQDASAARELITQIEEIVKFNPWRIDAIDRRNLEIAFEVSGWAMSYCGKAEAELVNGG